MELPLSYDKINQFIRDKNDFFGRFVQELCNILVGFCKPLGFVLQDTDRSLDCGANPAVYLNHKLKNVFLDFPRVVFWPER